MKLMKDLWRTLKAGVSVGTVKLPLHGSAEGNPAQRLLHHMAMQEMAGTNHSGEPCGFRIAPSSCKNPRTHSTRPTTRVEKLAKAAGMGATI